jgi:hypothetical protein
VIAVEVLLDAATVCAAGVAPPILKLKVTLVGDRLNPGFPAAAVTFSVTGSETGVLEAPVLATETDPV